MRMIGLDWGEVRVGVAVSDPLGMSAQPLRYLDNGQNFYIELKEVLIKHGIDKIVIGLPRQMSGGEGVSSAKVRLFSDKLIAELKIPVILWDERLTTKMAERSLIEAGTSRKKRKEMIDSISASMMLQSYLDSKNK